MCLCIQLLVFNIINIDCVNILGAPTPQEIKLDLVFIVLLKVAHNNRQWQGHGRHSTVFIYSSNGVSYLSFDYKK